MTHKELDAYRKERGLTQKDLAAICGRSLRCVQKWLAGTNPVPHWVDVILQQATEGK